ncbi:hypothetical protein DBV15_05754 [Temnothorax longispinosus]|uniref:Uncharacterized protein n=1 Tax=Temnothorax longispinosus TaxID=300112 RepID=A0A4S2KF39_9HYME|nr:hypothetical protein DBV15_05754 [Temnothorax longispinosus]
MDKSDEARRSNVLDNKSKRQADPKHNSFSSFDMVGFRYSSDVECRMYRNADVRLRRDELKLVRNDQGIRETARACALWLGGRQDSAKVARMTAHIG